jgi:putative Ca2+/H+ antiporter (TMEM165/GDT1 family)
MHAFLVSTAVVAIGEIGDKTQLLSLVLAARFRRPLPIVCGILVATLANHFLAGLVGQWIREMLNPTTLRWGLGLSFLAVALWTLKPDKLDEEVKPVGRYGVFLITVCTFFLAEMGDKTQLATVMLAAKYPSLSAVIAGSTTGMLLADVPVILLGSMAADRLPLKAIRICACGLLGILGITTLLGVGLF